MFSMLTTLDVRKPLIFRSVNEEHIRNIPDISVTRDVSKLLKSRLVNLQ